MSTPFTSYLPNIPAANDQLSTSQAQIQTNFGALQTWIDVNHVDYANGILGGMHNRVDFPTLGAAPANPGTIGGVITLYSQTSAYTSQPEICVQKQTNGVHYEFTSARYAAGTNLAPGWAIFPSGILLKWGTGTTDGSGSLAVTLNSAGQPTYSACYNGWTCATAFGAVTPLQFFSFTGTTTATFASGSAGQPYFFFVLGLANSN